MAARLSSVEVGEGQGPPRMQGRQARGAERSVVEGRRAQIHCDVLAEEVAVVDLILMLAQVVWAVMAVERKQQEVRHVHGLGVLLIVERRVEEEFGSEVVAEQQGFSRLDMAGAHQVSF